MKKEELKISSGLVKKKIRPKKRYKKQTGSDTVERIKSSTDTVKLKKRLTPNQKEFKKQQRRIRRFMTAAEKRGYTFNRAAVEELIKKPNVITKKRLENIKNIKPENLYKYATYKTESGKVVSGYEGRKIERKRSAEKAQTQRDKKVLKDMARIAAIKQYFASSQLQKEYKGFSNFEKSVLGRGIIKEIDEYYDALYQNYLFFKENNKATTLKKFIKEYFGEEGPEPEQVDDFNDVTEPEPPEPEQVDDFNDVTEPEQVDEIPNDIDMAFNMLRDNIDNLSIIVFTQTSYGWAWPVFIEHLNTWFNEKIASFGKAAVAEMLIQAYSFGVMFIVRDVYEKSHREATLNEFFNFIGMDQETQNLAGEITDVYHHVE